jgi:serine/threonine-protein kinase
MVKKLLQYDVLDRLGEGAKSTIYKVRDPGSGRIYALKHVVRKNDKDVRFVEQMEAEYAVSQSFHHPNIRRCFELKINKAMIFKVTEAFMTMELVEGLPLDQALPRSMIGIVDVFIQSAAALHAMHKAGFVHCDIKPINIMITDEGSIKIIDFGQSCKSGTVKERIQGTPDYIAPEQVARKPVTAQTDIFNLGATMYWSLTGRTIPTLYTVQKGSENAILSDDLFQTPQQLNPTVPEPFNRLVMECISTSPSKRPASMEVVIQRLELIKHILLKQAGKVQVEHSGASIAPDLYEDEKV